MKIKKREYDKRFIDLKEFGQCNFARLPKKIAALPPKFRRGKIRPDRFAISQRGLNSVGVGGGFLEGGRDGLAIQCAVSSRSPLYSLIADYPKAAPSLMMPV